MVTLWQGTKQLLRLQDTSASDMGDTLGVFLFCLDQSQPLMLPYQPWSFLRRQRG